MDGRWFLLAVGLLAVTSGYATDQRASLAGTMSTTGSAEWVAAGFADLGTASLFVQDATNDGVAQVSCGNGLATLWNIPLEEFRIMRGTEPEVRFTRALEGEPHARVKVTQLAWAIQANTTAFMASASSVLDVVRLTEPATVSIDGPRPVGRASFHSPTGHVGAVDDVPTQPSEQAAWLRIPDATRIAMPSGMSTAHFGGTWTGDTPKEIRDWPQGHGLNESRTLVDPVTGSGRLIYDTWFVHLSCSHATVALTPSFPLDVRTRSLQGVMAGDFQWNGVQSNLSLGGAPLQPESHILQVFGDVRFEGHVEGHTMEWALQGEVDAVQVDTLPVTWHVVAAGGGIALLSLLGRYVVQAVRAGVTIVLGRATPSLVKADVLASRSRTTILRAIHEQQLVTVADLVRSTGLSRSSVRYHIRILLAHEILQEHTAASRKKLGAYALNSQSLHVPLDTHPESGTFAAAETSPSAAEASTAIHTHSLRTSIFAVIRDQGYASMQDLQRSLRQHVGRGVARRTIGDHVAHLKAAGAIESSRRGRRLVYRARLDPEQIRIQQYRRFLRAVRLSEPMEILWRHAPLDAQAMEAEFSKHLRRGKRATKSIIKRLQALGLVDTQPGGMLLPAATIAPALGEIFAGE
jgi:DNA-binding transcriptional ArsR family regulator